MAYGVLVDYDWIDDESRKVVSLIRSYQDEVEVVAKFSADELENLTPYEYKRIYEVVTEMRMRVINAKNQKVREALE